MSMKRWPIALALALCLAAPARAITCPPGREGVNPYFWALMDQNPDTVGRLDAGGRLRMPVVRYDNEYYLSHDFSGKRSEAGTAFLDFACEIDPASQNLVVYGHNMRSGAVFGTLHRFLNRNYMKENCVIGFDTLYESRLYAPFAVFEFSATPENPAYFRIRRFDFTSDVDFSGYVGRAAARSILRLPMDVSAGDSLLTLVTCSYGCEDGRLAVMCRALRDGETPEAVRARFARW